MDRFGKKKQMGICPKCGSDCSKVTDSEIDLDCLWTNWYCNDCGESWGEYAILAYDGYFHNGKNYDKDGEECSDI